MPIFKVDGPDAQAAQPDARGALQAGNQYPEILKQQGLMQAGQEPAEKDLSASEEKTVVFRITNGFRRQQPQSSDFSFLKTDFPVQVTSDRADFVNLREMQLQRARVIKPEQQTKRSMSRSYKSIDVQPHADFSASDGSVVFRLPSNANIDFQKRAEPEQPKLLYAKESKEDKDADLVVFSLAGSKSKAQSAPTQPQSQKSAACSDRELLIKMNTEKSLQALEEYYKKTQFQETQRASDVLTSQFQDQTFYNAYRKQFNRSKASLPITPVAPLQEHPKLAVGHSGGQLGGIIRQGIGRMSMDGLV